MINKPLLITTKVNSRDHNGDINVTIFYDDGNHHTLDIKKGLLYDISFLNNNNMIDREVLRIEDIRFTSNINTYTIVGDASTPNNFDRILILIESIRSIDLIDETNKEDITHV